MSITKTLVICESCSLFCSSYFYPTSWLLYEIKSLKSPGVTHCPHDPPFGSCGFNLQSLSLSDRSPCDLSLMFVLENHHKRDTVGIHHLNHHVTPSSHATKMHFVLIVHQLYTNKCCILAWKSSDIWYKGSRMCPILHQRSILGQIWFHNGLDFQPKPRWPSAQQHFPHRLEIRGKLYLHYKKYNKTW